MLITCQARTLHQLFFLNFRFNPKKGSQKDDSRNLSVNGLTNIVHFVTFYVCRTLLVLQEKSISILSDFPEGPILGVGTR